MQSDSHNLKYMGIDGLGRLIKISPDIAEQHQLAVIDCLEVSRSKGNIFSCLFLYEHIVCFFCLMFVSLLLSNRIRMIH